MDTILWIVVFLIVLLFVALFLTSAYPEKPVHDLQRAMEKKRLMERPPTCEVIGTCARPCQSPSLNMEKKRYQKAADIDGQFMPPLSRVPEDYPTQKLGCCPYGKPLSQDLPMADAPMYMAKSSEDMRLRPGMPSCSKTI